MIGRLAYRRVLYMRQRGAWRSSDADALIGMRAARISTAAFVTFTGQRRKGSETEPIKFRGTWDLFASPLPCSFVSADPLEGSTEVAVAQGKHVTCLGPFLQFLVMNWTQPEATDRPDQRKKTRRIQQKLWPPSFDFIDIKSPINVTAAVTGWKGFG